MKKPIHIFCLIACCFIATNGFAQEVKPLFTITHADRLLYVYFSKDEKYVVTTSNEDATKIWETASGKLIAEQTNGLTMSKFSPDGKFVALLGDRKATIWEMKTGKLLQEFEKIAFWSFEELDFSNDSKYVVTALGKTAEIKETITGKLVWDLIHTGYVRSAEFSLDGKYLVTTSKDGFAKIWEVSTGKLLHSNKTGHNEFPNFKFSPTGDYFITGSGNGRSDGKIIQDDGILKIWETATGRLVQTLHDSYSFSPDGKYIYCDSWGNVKVLETSTGNLINNSVRGHVGAFSPNGKQIVTTSSDGAVRLWETTSGKLIRNFEGYKDEPQVTFSLNGEFIIGANDKVNIWETATGELLHSIPFGSLSSLSKDKKYLVATSVKSDDSESNNSFAKVWEIATGKLISDLAEHTYVWYTNFSPKGKYIVTQSIDKSLSFQKTKIWELSVVPKPVAPANLEIKSISFTDKNGNNNNVLDANEKAEIGFTVSNAGKGNAHNLVAEIAKILNGPWEKYQQQKIEYSKQVQIGNLVSGSNTTVTIPISATMNVESDTAMFEIQIREGNGFDADPIRVSFSTQKFKNPLVAIADHQFTTEGGKIKLGQLISLVLVLQNRGQGEASNIKVNFNNPQNVFPGSEAGFTIDKLKPNEVKKLTYEFFANKMYTAKEIPIEVSVIESYNQYGDKRTLNVSLEQTLSQTQSITIAGQVEKPFQIENVSLRSEVDTNIPVTEKIYQNRYALVVGNEDYKKYQTGLKSDQNVLFAQNDAYVFKEYVTKTMGVPEKQAFLLTDATRAQMNRELERVIELARLTPNAELIFYYAGHGLPDMETRQGYLIPVDVTASNLKDAISLKDLYSKLASSKAAKVLVFLDACFSGGGRGENGLVAARTVKVKPKGDIVEGNIVAFTATSGEEMSLPLNKEYHGLFTYYVLRKLKDTQGDLSLEQLKDYLEGEIPKASLIENGIRQTPQVLTAPDFNDKWLSWKFQN